MVRKPRPGSARFEKSKPRGAASWLAIPVFAAIYLIATFVGYVPLNVGLVYLVASLACFMAYAFDKSAAQAGRWRTSENTLLMLGLVGGWPGAIAAQQLLRHKTAKQSFQLGFWLTVVVNVAAFVALSLSPAHGFSAMLR